MLCVLPWTVEYWTGQDNANHLAVTHILQRFHEPGSPFAQYMLEDLRPRPYCLQYYLLLGLGRLVELRTADRILTSCIGAAIPLSVLALLARTARHRWANVYFVVPLASGTFLVFGFLNYLLGVVLGLLAVALAWGRPGGRAGPTCPPASGPALAGAAVLFLLALLAHPFGALMTGLLLVLLEGSLIWRERAWGRLAVVFGPSALFWLVDTIQGTRLPQVTAGAGANFIHFDIFTTMMSITRFATFSGWEMPFRLFAALVLIVGAVRTIRRKGLRGQHLDARLGRLLLGCFCVYLILPAHAMDVGYISLRFTLVLYVVCALAADLPSWLRDPIRPGIVGLVIAVALLGIQHRGASAHSRQMKDLVEASQVVPRGSTVLPIDFSSYAGSGNRWYRLELHSWGHAVVDRDIVTPYLFAAGGTTYYGGQRYRPIGFSRPFAVDFFPNPAESSPVPLRAEKCEEKAIVEICRFWRDLRFRELVAMAEVYDRTIVTRPPDEFLEIAQERLVVESNVGEIHVMRPRNGRVDELRFFDVRDPSL